jgi:predicted lipoprotein with Yx(FWY)xxD motif
MTPKQMLIALTGLFGGCALFASMQVPVQRESDVLVDADGMTLYTFDRDGRGKSVCDGECAKLWPPLAAGDDARSAGSYEIIVRVDRRRQWAYKGKPLYRSVKDQKAGDRSGHGFDNLWRTARP